MSDEVETMLREEFDRLARRPQPDPAAMLTRVTRARRRHTAIVAAGVAVLVITVGTAVAWRRSPAVSLPPPATAPADLIIADPPDLYFADADHGFALAGACPDAVCQTWLAVTEDGGRRWQSRQVPGLNGQQTDSGLLIRARMRVLDANRVVLDAYDGDRRWFTADAGRTWAEVDPAPQATVEEFPALAQASVQTNAGQPIGVTVLMPDGTSARLAHPPVVPIIQGHTDVAFAPDGSAWLQGGDDAHDWAFVSRDRGRTWRQLPLPALPGQPGQRMIEVNTGDGRTAYLPDQVGFQIWRTRDDGRNWQRIEAPIARPVEDVGLSTQAQPDGSLLFYDVIGGRVYTLTATGTRFEPAAPGIRPAAQIGARFLRGTGIKGRQPPYLHSADGTTWTELHL